MLWYLGFCRLASHGSCSSVLSMQFGSRHALVPMGTDLPPHVSRKFKFQVVVVPDNP